MVAGGVLELAELEAAALPVEAAAAPGELHRVGRHDRVEGRHPRRAGGPAIPLVIEAGKLAILEIPGAGLEVLHDRREVLVGVEQRAGTLSAALLLIVARGHAVSPL